MASREHTVRGKRGSECFSTTKNLTTIPPNASAFVQGAYPLREAPRQQGGLRTKGLYKSNLAGPLLTVITVNYNGGPHLEETILSVLNQSYSNIEYIVIDGGSTDGAVDLLRRYEDAIDYWVSEPDKGIYDAMNKGIRLSSGEWLNFLNVKDVFYDRSTVETVAETCFKDSARFIYSDVMLTGGGREPFRYVCDHRRKIINHQASIYRKSLHEEHGLYMVAPKLSIADYVFFSLVSSEDFRKIASPIAIYDTTGVSQSRRAMEQKFVVDYLLNGLSRYELTARMHLYYYYRKCKMFLMRL